MAKADYIETFPYAIQYKQGKEKIVANALCRCVLFSCCKVSISTMNMTTSFILPSKLCITLVSLIALDLNPLLVDKKESLIKGRMLNWVKSIPERVLLQIKRKNLCFPSQ